MAPLFGVKESLRMHKRMLVNSRLNPRIRSVAAYSIIGCPAVGKSWSP